MVSRGTGFHPNNARLQLFEKAKQLAAPELLRDDDVARSVDAVHLKHTRICEECGDDGACSFGATPRRAPGASELDGTTSWLFPESAKAGLIEMLFDRFDQHLDAHGYIARGGTHHVRREFSR